MHQRKCLLGWNGWGWWWRVRVEKIQSFLCNFREGNPRIREIAPTHLRSSIHWKPIMRIPLAFLWSLVQWSSDQNFAVTLGQLSKILRVATETRLDKEVWGIWEGRKKQGAPQGSECLWGSSQRQDSCSRKLPTFWKWCKGFLAEYHSKMKAHQWIIRR